MNRQTILQTIHDDTEERLHVFADKSNDYATEDALSNFKRMNILCKTLDIDYYHENNAPPIIASA